MRPRTWAWFLLCLLTLNICRAGTPESLVVATFNLENYLLEPAGNRPSKSIAARDQVAREIAAIRPDVLAIQEIGPGGAMGDLQQRVRTAGWELPHTEVVGGWDTNIWVAVLSRYPFRARRSHTNDSFLLGGRRWHSSRGIAEVDVEPRPGIRFTLLSTHLKSKRPSANADEAELREAETRLLRQHVDAAFQRDPHVALIVCGDLNDHKDSRPIRLLLGKGPGALVDTRPAEREVNGSRSQSTEHQTRRVVWTHHYAQEDSYARFDYILLSRTMAKRWRPAGSYVFADPDWGLASDHRPVVCEFSLNN